MPEFKEGPKTELPQGIALRSTLQVQAGNINEIAWSPDGATLASGDPDGVIGLWDVASGVQRARLERFGEGGLVDRLFAGRVAGGDRLERRLGGSFLRLRRAAAPARSSVTRAGFARFRFRPTARPWRRAPTTARFSSGILASGERRLVLDGHRERVLSLRYLARRLEARFGRRRRHGDGLGCRDRRIPGPPPDQRRLAARGLAGRPTGGWWPAAAKTARCGSCAARTGGFRRCSKGTAKGSAAFLSTPPASCSASRSVDGRVRIWTPSRGSWRLLARFKEPASFPMANMAFHPREMLLATVAQSRIRLWQIDFESLRSAADGQKAARLVSTKVVVLGGAPAAELVAGARRAAARRALSAGPPARRPRRRQRRGHRTPRDPAARPFRPRGERRERGRPPPARTPRRAGGFDPPPIPTRAPPSAPARRSRRGWRGSKSGPPGRFSSRWPTGRWANAAKKPPSLPAASTSRCSTCRCPASWWRSLIRRASCSGCAKPCSTRSRRRPRRPAARIVGHPRRGRNPAARRTPERPPADHRRRPLPLLPRPRPGSRPGSPHAFRRLPAPSSSCAASCAGCASAS